MPPKSEELLIRSPRDLREYGLLRLRGLQKIWKHRIAETYWAANQHYPDPAIGVRKLRSVDALGYDGVAFARRLKADPDARDESAIWPYASTTSNPSYAELRPFMCFSAAVFTRLIDPSSATRTMAAQQQSGYQPSTNPHWLSPLLHETLHPTATAFERMADAEDVLTRAFASVHRDAGEHFRNRASSPDSRKELDALIREHVSEYATSPGEIIPEALVRWLTEGPDAPPLSRAIGAAVDRRFRFDAPHLDELNQVRLGEIEHDRSGAPAPTVERKLWIPEWARADERPREPASQRWLPLSFARDNATFVTSEAWIRPWARPLTPREAKHFDDPDLGALARSLPNYFLERSKHRGVIDPDEFDRDFPLGPPSKVDWGTLDPNDAASFRRPPPPDRAHVPARDTSPNRASAPVDSERVRRGRRRGSVATLSPANSTRDEAGISHQPERLQEQVPRSDAIERDWTTARETNERPDTQSTPAHPLETRGLRIDTGPRKDRTDRTALELPSRDLSHQQR